MKYKYISTILILLGVIVILTNFNANVYKFIILIIIVIYLHKIKLNSNYDEITGVLNRKAFKEKVEKIIDDAKISHRNLALILINIDNFKHVNNTYGYEIGDKLLKKVSEKIKKMELNNSLLGRVSGDEFVVLIDYSDSFEHLEKILKQIVKECNINFSIEDRKIYCSVSVGTSIFRRDGIDFNKLIRGADLAMYMAKKNGENTYEFFNDDILKKINREIDIKEGLREAFLKKELFGVLQPKYEIITKNIIGFEYLIRWKSEKLGFVPAGEFIKVAENTGQMSEVGSFIIMDAIRMCKKLNMLTERDFKIAINLSEVQLRDASIINFIKENIKKYEVNPKNIEFEITESIIMENVEKNISVLEEFRNIGITVALDDFGTGYSSLNYLRILPIDILKIDKSFIDYINKDKKSEYIIERIIDLSYCFKFSVVAEGVETEEQFEFLKRKKCDIVQGYYFSKPLNFSEIYNLLRKKENESKEEKVICK